MSPHTVRTRDWLYIAFQLNEPRDFFAFADRCKFQSVSLSLSLHVIFHFFFLFQFNLQVLQHVDEKWVRLARWLCALCYSLTCCRRRLMHCTVRNPKQYFRFENKRFELIGDDCAAEMFTTENKIKINVRRKCRKNSQMCGETMSDFLFSQSQLETHIAHFKCIMAI